MNALHIFPYKDELAYSLFSRYSVKRGYISFASIAEELFVNSKCRPNIELCNQPNSQMYKQLSPIEAFLAQHTMLNYYLAFLPPNKEQIRLAFAQAEKEVEFLRRRTVEGLRQAKANGVQLGNSVGATFETKKGRTAKEIIVKHAKAFGGSLDDPDVIKLCGCSRNSYYKYKRELMSA